MGQELNGCSQVSGRPGPGGVPRAAGICRLGQGWAELSESIFTASRSLGPGVPGLRLPRETCHPPCMAPRQELDSRGAGCEAMASACSCFEYGLTVAALGPREESAVCGARP